jgi:SAM-dependent methyltransferase
MTRPDSSPIRASPRTHAGDSGPAGPKPPYAVTIRPERDGIAHLDGIYQTRFDDRRQAGKMAVWAELTAFLHRWIDPARPVIDIACDAGYFIRHVRATERWATDVRDVASLLPPEVRFVHADGLRLSSHVPADHFGTVFMSNYLEHLGSVDEVVEQLRVAHDILAPGGRLIVLQPNVRLTGGSYWDFIDHRVPLTERSLEEAVTIAGLRPIHLTTRFLPYSTKGRLPQFPILVRWYLRLPFAWRLFGKQTLLVAERPDPGLPR